MSSYEGYVYMSPERETVSVTHSGTGGWKIEVTDTLILFRNESGQIIEKMHEDRKVLCEGLELGEADEVAHALLNKDFRRASDLIRAIEDSRKVDGGGI